MLRIFLEENMVKSSCYSEKRLKVGMRQFSLFNFHTMYFYHVFLLLIWRKKNLLKCMFSPYSGKNENNINNNNQRMICSYPARNTFPAMSLMWTEKNDFYPHFLYKEDRAKGSQWIAQGLWRGHVEETALTFYHCPHAHLQGKNWWEEDPSFLALNLGVFSLYISFRLTKRGNHWLPFLKANEAMMKF